MQGGSYNITKTVEDEYEEVKRDYPEKLILGVPYYGDRWQTATSYAYSSAIKHLGHPRYATAYEESLQHGLKWDYRSMASWYTYQNNNNKYQVWFETDRSLGLKYDLAEKHKLKGVGMWALGYDKHRTELWDELRKRYSEISSNKPVLSSSDVSLCVYPNPISRIGYLELDLPYDGEINIDLYDASGLTVLKLYKRWTHKGKTIASWSVEDLPPGIYFLQVDSPSFPEFHNITKKILFLK